MGLVDYSDSENSDASPSQTTSRTAAAPTAKPKNAFAKVIDRSESGKIRVALPELKPEESTAPEDTIEAPAAKRPKTSGAFSGFSSLLPPPKNAGKKVGGDSSGGAGGSTAAARGSGPGRGVSLRTGAAPAFSREREPARVEEAQAEPEDDAPDDHARDNLTPVVTQSHKQEEPKLIGKPLMFKPLSVSRKPQAKKKRQATRHEDAEDSGSQSAVLAVSASAQVKPAKPKVSLFGTAPETNGGSESLQKTNGYQPLLQDAGDEQSNGHEELLPDMQQTQNCQSKPPQSSANELESVANSLKLSASERRQLFGRKGQPTDAQIAQFSLAEEYHNNNKMREDESSAPQLNPVKSIAPGKHSLSQLVNAATGQKDALEDAFAQGRRNKREGATRYGWG